MTIMQERFLHFLCRQPALPVGGESCGNDDYGVHWNCVVALAVAFNWQVACTYMPNASWRRRGSKAQGRGLPTLGGEPKAERKRRSEAEVCTSEARKIGEALAPREGNALRKAWFPYLRSSERLILGSVSRVGIGLWMRSAKDKGA